MANSANGRKMYGLRGTNHPRFMDMQKDKVIKELKANLAAALEQISKLESDLDKANKKLARKAKAKTKKKTTSKKSAAK